MAETIDYADIESKDELTPGVLVYRDVRSSLVVSVESDDVEKDTVIRLKGGTGILFVAEIGSDSTFTVAWATDGEASQGAERSDISTPEWVIGNAHGLEAKDGAAVFFRLVNDFGFTPA